MRPPSESDANRTSWCSNALTLEHLTREHPHAGSLITFAQFVLISLHGLPKFVIFSAWGVPRLRARRTPLAPYLAQVALFYAVSLLNNAAFAYGIPMAVHIIFRSGGLVVSMLMGWLLAGKRCVPVSFSAAGRRAFGMMDADVAVTQV